MAAGGGGGSAGHLRALHVDGRVQVAPAQPGADRGCRARWGQYPGTYQYRLRYGAYPVGALAGWLGQSVARPLCGEKAAVALAAGGADSAWRAVLRGASGLVRCSAGSGNRASTITLRHQKGSQRAAFFVLVILAVPPW